MATELSDIGKPTTLKDALNLFGALGLGKLKDRVVTTIEERVKNKLKHTTELKSVAEKIFIKNNFNDVLNQLESLRKEIVGDTVHDNYGDYSVISYTSDYAYVELCVKYILDILPPLYATLCFLKFEVDEDDSEELGGGGWAQHFCNSHSASHPGTSLNQWITSQEAVVPATPSSTTSIMPGGYSSNLSETLENYLSRTPGSDLRAIQGGELVNTLNDLTLDSEDCGTSFHKLLLSVAIAAPWSPCNVATCLAVLRAVCDESDKTFSGHTASINGLGTVLKTLSEKLKLLAPNDNEGDEALLTALFEGSPKMYAEHVTSESFDTHVKWLKEILDQLTPALNSLKVDCKNWSKNDLEKATISGPFSYGFSFGGKWKSQWSDDVKKEIPGAIAKLTGVLDALKSCLEQYSKTFVSPMSGVAVGHGFASTSTSVSSESGSDRNHNPGSSGTLIDAPVPKDLKEAIDWILRVSGGDGVDKEKSGVKGLATAVYKLVELHVSNEVINIKHNIESTIATLADGLTAFVGYTGGTFPSGSGMASTSYKSVYELGVTWRWADDSERNAAKCAKIFLACVPLFYYAITYLYWRCAKISGYSGVWEAMPFNGKSVVNGTTFAYNGLTNFMEAVGYSNSGKLSSNSGGSIMTMLKETFNELETAPYNESAYLYGDFLRHVEKTGKRLSSTPDKCPLYTLHYVAEAYWASEPVKNNGIRAAIDTIRNTFESISKTNVCDYGALKSIIKDLHEKLEASLTPSTPEPASAVSISLNSESAGNNSQSLQPQQQHRVQTSVPPAASAASPKVEAFENEKSGSGEVESAGPVGPIGARGPAGPQGPRGDKGETAEQELQGSLSSSSSSSATTHPATPPPRHLTNLPPQWPQPQVLLPPLLSVAVRQLYISTSVA
ncbi:variant erythrocyte surface antigen-1 family protein [Babesia caballi]|uniref:Variant erythrocyte surface antigen-1 family protein n=1 Tax=Babesia caballi TaxID=5871 RepID=A0AAV4LM59_BABCB|nr:variant erythrocyte surface antigen-1 family protein [Babesia caballi]